eukprot:TRINITY_DN76672_c0_g1_i1.p1 TRINITY_DN76672_c0_g1~~TRINITY_DN76672_c0_g1_i1.p1  ORF type:complete len:757 (+),score=165.38 TRINITY_DN76672_c0_g1_i1:161-2431(+)
MSRRPSSRAGGVASQRTTPVVALDGLDRLSDEKRTDPVSPASTSRLAKLRRWSLSELTGGTRTPSTGRSPASPTSPPGTRPGSSHSAMLPDIPRRSHASGGSSCSVADSKPPSRRSSLCSTQILECLPDCRRPQEFVHPPTSFDGFLTPARQSSIGSFRDSSALGGLRPNLAGAHTVDALPLVSAGDIPAGPLTFDSLPMTVPADAESDDIDDFRLVNPAASGPMRRLKKVPTGGAVRSRSGSRPGSASGLREAGGAVINGNVSYSATNIPRLDHLDRAARTVREIGLTSPTSASQGEGLSPHGAWAHTGGLESPSEGCRASWHSVSTAAGGDSCSSGQRSRKSSKAGFPTSASALVALFRGGGRSNKVSDKPTEDERTAAKPAAAPPVSFSPLHEEVDPIDVDRVVSGGSEARRRSCPAIGALDRATQSANSSSIPRKETREAMRRARRRAKIDMRLEERGKKHQTVFKRFAEGENIFALFEMEEEVRSDGGRGAITLARRQSDGLAVAIKVRRKKANCALEAAWKAIMTQLKTMSENQYVLDLTDIFEDDEAFYIIMPRCNGGELFDFLINQEEVSEKECKRLLRQILSAVGHLHEHHLVHRDIKPENIMFMLPEEEKNSKSIRLIDFDTCMEFTPGSPRINKFVGTPGYIAPEALLGEVSPQGDIFSVGVILYILITGCTPFRNFDSLEDGTVGSQEALAMYQAMQEEQIAWNAAPWPQLPLAKDLCERMLKFNSCDRLRSVKEALAHPWLTK